LMFSSPLLVQRAKQINVGILFYFRAQLYSDQFVGSSLSNFIEDGGT
jgi:hypothetical protein